MKRIIPIFCLAFCLALPLLAGAIQPIDGLTPEKLLGGAENLKIVATAKAVTVYRIVKGSTGNQNESDHIVIDGLKCVVSQNAVSGDEQQKVVAAFSDATNFGEAAGVIVGLAHPDIIMRFKTDAGALDIIVSFPGSEMMVYRDGKLVHRLPLRESEAKNTFGNTAAAAFIALAKKAFPDDPGIKALQPPPMSTADLITALGAAAAAYYDYYHAIPETPENYVVTAALTGKTRDHVSYIQLNSSQVSPNGEILDEWGTPLRFIFTQDTAKPIQAWSAGKDKVFGTADDLSKPDSLPQ